MMNNFVTRDCSRKEATEQEEKAEDGENMESLRRPFPRSAQL